MAVRLFFTGIQRLLWLLKTEISCVKTDEAIFIQFQSVFFETSHHVLALTDSHLGHSHAVTMQMRLQGEGGKTVTKVHLERRRRLKREQYCPLLPLQSSADV